MKILDYSSSCKWCSVTSVTPKMHQACFHFGSGPAAPPNNLLSPFTPWSVETATVDSVHCLSQSGACRFKFAENFHCVAGFACIAMQQNKLLYTVILFHFIAHTWAPEVVDYSDWLQSALQNTIEHEDGQHCLVVPAWLAHTETCM